MIRFATLACAIALAAPLPTLAETEWSWTGQNSGTAAGARDCTRANGTFVCSGQSTYTGPQGQTSNQSFESTGNANGGQRVTTFTRPGGESRTRTFNWQRN
jgi:hypothetical protein